MNTIHVRHSAAWSGLLFLVLAVVGGILPGPLPALTTPPAEIATYIDAHRFGLLLGAWMNLPAAAFFLWFVLGLRTLLRSSIGDDEGLPMFVLIAAVITSALTLIGASVQALLAYALFGQAAAALLYGLMALLGTFAFGTVGVMLFAAAHSIRRHQSAPSWLAWFGYLAALGCGASSLGVFVQSGFMAPGGMGALFVGLAPLGIWMIGICITMLRTRYA